MSKVIKVNEINEKTIEYLNRNYAKEADAILEINNTRGVSSSLIEKLNPNYKIRIVGGYTEELLRYRFYNDSFVNATTYTRNEVVQIIRKIEEIEKGIIPNWSQIQKTLYIFNKLKSYIIYDKDFEIKDKSNMQQADIEMRSLRALISRKCVCAGYALILKEMLDRQGIENEYVIGGTKENPGNHAWVIANINNRKFPLDLTWGALAYRMGNRKSSYNYFANINRFVETHIPDMGNKTMDYERDLVGLKPEFVERIAMPLIREENYPITTFKSFKRNGATAYICQINERVIDGRVIYEYAYVEKNSMYNRFSSPIILSTSENVAALVKKSETGLTAEENQKLDMIVNDLFSFSNINDSFRRGSNYLGMISNNGFGMNYIRKDDEMVTKTKLEMMTFIRDDGTSFVLKKGPKYIVDGKIIQSFDCCEFIKDSDGRDNFQKNKLFSEQNLLTNSGRNFVNYFLSRERINKLARQNGGYIGQYTTQGTILYDENIKKAFKLNRANWTKDDIERCKKYQKEKHIFTRSDGSQFTLTRMHANPREIKRKHIVQYEYTERVPKKGGGTISRKKSIFAQDNLISVLRDQYVIDYEFSREKMSDDNLLKTGRYIGIWNPSTRRFEINSEVAGFFIENKGMDLASKKYEDRIKRIYKRGAKTIKRTDGTSFKLREIAPKKDIKLYGKKVYQYEYVEDIKTAPWIRERKRYILFSEENLLKERRQEVIDYLLSQKRIERKVRESGGYLGYYDQNGKRNVVGKRERYFRYYKGRVNFETFPNSYSINSEEIESNVEEPKKINAILEKKKEQDKEFYFER